MTSVAFTFDRYAYIDRLRREAGIDEKTALAHAEALDGALRDAVATKADLAEVRTELKQDIHAIDARIDVLEANVKTWIAEAMHKHIVWTIGTVIATAGLVAAIVKLL